MPLTSPMAWVVGSSNRFEFLSVLENGDTLRFPTLDNNDDETLDIVNLKTPLEPKRPLVAYNSQSQELTPDTSQYNFQLECGSSSLCE